MERQEVVSRLRHLRGKLEKDDILFEPIPAALLLSDICDVLGLGQAEQNAVLGQEAAEAVEEWSSARMWILREKGTAAQPVTKLAAVPA